MNKGTYSKVYGFLIPYLWPLEETDLEMSTASVNGLIRNLATGCITILTPKMPKQVASI
jgi:hypothetical protein